jgi:hypothetical protein
LEISHQNNIDLNDYFEITRDEYVKLGLEETAYFRDSRNNEIYFKKKDKYPKVFEKYPYKLIVHKKEVIINFEKIDLCFGEINLPLLLQAVFSLPKDVLDKYVEEYNGKM